MLGLTVGRSRICTTDPKVFSNEIGKKDAIDAMLSLMNETDEVLTMNTLRPRKMLYMVNWVFFALQYRNTKEKLFGELQIHNILCMIVTMRQSRACRRHNRQISVALHGAIPRFGEIHRLFPIKRAGVQCAESAP